MRLLLLSNSTLPGEPFLQWPRPHLSGFLTAPARIAFIPYAAVTFTFDAYADAVAGPFAELGHTVVSVHRSTDPVAAVDAADAVAVGGGNTFQLLRLLYKHDLLRAIRRRVREGMPYVGWSAGSNVACPTIMTTNDMPITEPPSFRALDLVPFQINPHYTDARLEGHGGETRDQRLAEFLVANPQRRVIGLREGSLLHVTDERMRLVGRPARLFRSGTDPVELAEGSDLRADLAGH